MYSELVPVIFSSSARSSGSHCTKWAHDQQNPAGYEPPCLTSPFPKTSTIKKDLVSNPVWWEARDRYSVIFSFVLFRMCVLFICSPLDPGIKMTVTYSYREERVWNLSFVMCLLQEHITVRRVPVSRVVIGFKFCFYIFNFILLNSFFVFCHCLLLPYFFYIT